MGFSCGKDFLGQSSFVEIIGLWSTPTPEIAKNDQHSDTLEFRHSLRFELAPAKVVGEEWNAPFM